MRCAALVGLSKTFSQAVQKYILDELENKDSQLQYAAVTAAVNAYGKDKVSAKKNGFGMEMAPIIAKEDVAQTLKKAVEVELTNRGFCLRDGGVTLVGHAAVWRCGVMRATRSSVR